MQPVDQHTDDKPPVSIDDDLGDLSALEIHPTLTSSGSGVSADTNHSGTAGGTGSQAEGDIFAESSAACRTSRKHNKPRQQQQQHRRHHREHHLAVKGSIDESNGRGMLYKAIPVMPLWLAVSCCCLNIVIPGTGIYIAFIYTFLSSGVYIIIHRVSEKTVQNSFSQNFVNFLLILIILGR